MTASAVVRRSSRSGDSSRLSATSSLTGSSSPGVLDLDRARLLLEQPRPRLAAADRLLGHDLLLRLGEEIRPVAAHRAQVVAARVEAVGAEQLVGALVVDRGPLEVEEEELRLDRGRLLADPRDERAVRRVDRVDGEAQVRVVARAGDELGDRLELGHRLGEPGAVEPGDVSRVAPGERRRPLVGLGQHAVGPLGALAVDQRVEVPRDVLHIDHAHLRNVTRRCAERTNLRSLRTSCGGRDLDFAERAGIGSPQTRNRAAKSEAPRLRGPPPEPGAPFAERPGGRYLRWLGTASPSFNSRVGTPSRRHMRDGSGP